MKRVGGLFESIYERENLRSATAKALRGKRNRSDARQFVENLESELRQLACQIEDLSIPLGDFRQFIVHDPKKRLISAPAFRERVFHHAVMNVCEPVLESFSIFDSYACRLGKGQFAALERAQRFARRSEWFLKLDVVKYFYSIDRDVLLRKLARRFREPKLLRLLEKIIQSFEPEKSVGLPIGALTSQHFANFYLGHLDRFVKERLRAKYYLRYMDDFVVWSDSKQKLMQVAGEIAAFSGDELGLALKPALINRVSVGMDFLGHGVYSGNIRLNRRSRRRFVDKAKHISRQVEAEQLTEPQAQERFTALTAFTEHAACRDWRRRVLFGYG